VKAKPQNIFGLTANHIGLQETGRTCTKAIVPEVCTADVGFMQKILGRSSESGRCDARWDV